MWHGGPEPNFYPKSPGRALTESFGVENICAVACGMRRLAFIWAGYENVRIQNTGLKILYNYLYPRNGHAISQTYESAEARKL